MSISPDMQLTDYLRVAKRRKLHFLLPFVLTAGVAIALAFGLPTMYKSEATLLIERQSVPTNFVESTVNSYVQEIIQQITQQILTYENLLRIAGDYEMFTEKQISEDPRTVVETMRDSFSVNMLDVKASDPNKAGTRQATIAFTVGFIASTPEKARAITAEIADSYLREHQRKREAQAEKVRLFLEAEADKLRVEIVEKERQLAEFKQGEIHTLPELMGMNLKLFEKTEEQIQYSQDRVRELEDRLNSINAEMSVTPLYDNVRTDEGGELLSATERLNSLVAQYARTTSRYSAKHPDVIRLTREIRTLSEQTGTAGRVDELMSELVSIQEDLRQAQQKYGPEHPNVVRLEKAAGSLKQSFQNALSTDNDSVDAAAPNNPRYVALQSQLRATESAHSAERSKLVRLEEKLRDYEGRIFATPEVDARYQSLSRDYANAVAKYNELTNQQIDSRLAETLEAGDGGEQFLLSSPAYLPKLPDSPNRIGILLIGILLAGLFGAIAAAIAEHADRAIYEVRDITAILGTPPLAVIPKLT